MNKLLLILMIGLVESALAMCPSGYHQSGGYCVADNKYSKPAVPNPRHVSCPSGWHLSGDFCLKDR